MSRDDDRRELCRERGVALYEMLVATRETLFAAVARVDNGFPRMQLVGLRDLVRALDYEIRECEPPVCTPREHRIIWETDDLWAALPYKGVQDDGVVKLEMRDCERCGSTLSRPVPREAA